MYDLNTAMQLSSFLLIFVAFFLFLERYERNKLSYSYGSSSFKKTRPQKLKGISNYLAFTFCFLPIFVGFILPILEISSWAIFYTSDNFFSDKFISSFLNTIYLGFLAAIFCTFFSLGLNFLKRFDKSILLSSTSFSLSLGYAVPGLVLAIGITQFFSFLDNEIFKSFLNITLVGSVFGLLLAYVIKSYALANSAIESGFQRIDSSIDDVSRTLKKSKLGIMFRIHMPLLKTSIFTSILLVISEVIKELPATLILRPFNFDTLAVSTYLYAAEERMYEAAAPAMMIVLIGLVPIIFLSKIIRDSRPGK
jgi:iron(III) transport system permease protein